jgi:hypothetical protein
MATAPHVCFGFLTKQGRMVKSMKRRFFVLEMGRLSYFEKPSGIDSPPYGIGWKGSLSMIKVTIQESTYSGDMTKILLVNLLDKRELLLVSDSAEDASRWRRALQLHIAFAATYPDIAFVEGDNFGEEKEKIRRASLLGGLEQDNPEHVTSSPVENDAADRLTVIPIPGFVMKVRREDKSKV